MSDHGIQTMNWHDFAPRFGAAYQVNTKTVIRAGFGWGYDLGAFGSTFGHNVTQNPPVLTNQQYNPCRITLRTCFRSAEGPGSRAGDRQLERDFPAAERRQPQVPACNRHVPGGLSV